MSNNHPIVIARALCVIVAFPVSAVADDTARLLNIYIEELRRETKDPVKLAERLLQEAAKVTDNPALRSGLYQKAYEYGMQSAKGHASAQTAMETVLALAPKGKVQWWEQLVKVRQQMYSRKSGADRQAMSEKLVSALASAGDACLDERLATKASGYYQRAGFLARLLRLPRQGELVAKTRKANALVGIGRQVERCETRLKSNPGDDKARVELIRLLVVELDDPGEAQAYLDATVAKSWRENIPLAMKDPREMDEAACLALGVWYAKLARTAAVMGKVAALSRVRTYYRRYLTLHTRQDPDRARAETALAGIEKTLAKLDWTAGLAGTLVLDLGGGVDLKLVFIPAGTFRMGSKASAAELSTRFGRTSTYFTDEHPQHAVTITKPFHMGVHEVTRGQFGKFAGATAYRTDAEKQGEGVAWTVSKWEKVAGASWRRPGFPQTDSHPVAMVSWNDATAFCTWLGARTGKAVALPTEAQWEYACRGGTTTMYQWGDDPRGGKGWCNVLDQTGMKKTGMKKIGSAKALDWSDGHAFTAPVGSYRKNAFGLYDMHGNVWEWCRDWYDKSYYADSKNAMDPTGPSASKTRKTHVIRGGAWTSSPHSHTSADRNRQLANARFFSYGFRVVVSGVSGD